MPPRRRLTSIVRKAREKNHPAILILLGLMVIFGIVLAVSEPLPGRAAAREELATISDPQTPLPTHPAVSRTLTITVTPSLVPTPTLTPLPEEYLTNAEQTIGIIIGTVVLVVLVIGGTLAGALARRRE